MKIKRFLPILDWLPNYQKSYLQGDLTAGLTVGIMLIPQGMAYAMIAGLPPVYGLYASMMPQVVYAIFGTSRQLAVGPVAMDSLLVAAGVSMMAEVGSENYIALALLLALMMGVAQLAFGLLRLGFLVNFLSKPVISGFTSAAALIIGLSQLKHLVGVDLGRSSSIFDVLESAFANIGAFNWLSIGIGVGAILLIKNVKRLHKAIPGALAAVVVGILVVQFGGLDQYGIKIVGTIPEGLPSFAIPPIDSPHLQELLPIALSLSLIAFMEAISVSKALHGRHKGEYELDANQELIGIGMGNIVGSFFGSYPTTGGFSRSAVNDQAGAKTNFAAIISASLIALTLLFLTPLFYYLPNTILAVIIMVAVFGLIDFKYPQFLWKTRREDFYMLVVSFIVTLTVGIQEGIEVGVVLSLIVMVYRSTRPHTAILGKLPDSNEYRNTSRFKDVQTRPDVLVIRYDAQIYFANTSHFVETIKKGAEGCGEQLKLIVLDCGSISYIDSTALQAFQELVVDLKKQGIEMYLAEVIGPVRDFLRLADFMAHIGESHFFLDIQSAVDYFDKDEKQREVKKVGYATQTGVLRS